MPINLDSSAVRLLTQTLRAANSFSTAVCLFSNCSSGKSESVPGSPEISCRIYPKGMEYFMEVTNIKYRLYRIVPPPVMVYM